MSWGKGHARNFGRREQEAASVLSSFFGSSFSLGERERRSTKQCWRWSIVDLHDAWGALEICSRKAAAELKGRVGLQQLPPDELDDGTQLSALSTYTWLVSTRQRTGAGGAGSSCTSSAQLWCATELGTTSRNTARQTTSDACDRRSMVRTFNASIEAGAFQVGSYEGQPTKSWAWTPQPRSWG